MNNSPPSGPTRFPSPPWFRSDPLADSLIKTPKGPSINEYNEIKSYILYKLKKCIFFLRDYINKNENYENV